MKKVLLIFIILLAGTGLSAGAYNITYSVFSSGGVILENNGEIIMQSAVGQSIASDSNIFYNASS
ncbi:MAG TPA: hypothetical protein PLQ81_11550 [bacterium]|nr:hypothetical protein [bacterium]